MSGDQDKSYRDPTRIIHMLQALERYYLYVSRFQSGNLPLFFPQKILYSYFFSL